MAKGSSRKNENGLNDKQQKFADRYLLNGNNAAEAYRFAYNNKEKDDKRAANKASLIMQRNVCISVYIEKKSAELREKAAAETEDAYTKILHLCLDVLNGSQITNWVEQGESAKMGKYHKGRSLTKEWAANMLAKLEGLEKQKVEVSGNLDGAINFSFESVDEYLKKGRGNE